MATFAREVVAVDGSPHAARFASPTVQFIQADLRRPLELQRTFEVVLCLEVLEHIPEEAEDIVCETMARHTGRWLIATAAPPGQKGRQHVNLKPLPYWIEKLSALNLRHEPEMVTRWQSDWRTAGVLYYFVDNLMIFHHSG
jgi:2-polyprenyl-3-methyl-5-hydroxy-6-metoxy-1,4-benzoquinol methylase